MNPCPALLDVGREDGDNYGLGRKRVMAKKEVESDEARLRKKVAEKLSTHNKPENPEGDAALRSLRKRLKREQRKRRALALRKKHAGGGKPADAVTPAA
jgi:hypothetical protein